MTSSQASTTLLDAAQDLCRKLGGTWHGSYGICRCPTHKDSSPSLSVRIGERSLLFKCWAGCKARDIMRELHRIGGQLPVREYGVKIERDQRPTQALIAKLWHLSTPITATRGQRYLEARGVKVRHGTSLRYLAHTKHGPENRWFPAILGPVHDSAGQLVALHRTFLDPNRPAKAPVANARLILGHPGDGMIRLTTAGTMLGITEGIEKAMAAAEIHHCPTWSCVSASRFGSVSIPDRITYLRVFADRDPPGMRAAEKAVERHAREGRTITIEPPPAPYVDWDELLLARKRRETL